MTGLVRKATLLSVCGLMLVAGAAMAGIPSEANTQKPCVILMDLSNSTNNVGVNAGVCGINALKVIVRDALNNPVANSDVVLDFSTCPAGPPIPVKLADTQADPLVTTACLGRTILKTTNAQGEVCFSALGATDVVDLSSGHPFYTGLTVRNLGPSAGVVCCKLYASGILMGTQLVIVNKYDLNNDGNVSGSDGTFHLSAQGFQVAGNYRTFPDYNCDGTVSGTDGSLGLSSQGNGLAGETVYGGTYCP